jgi:hypothetical protein
MSETIDKNNLPTSFGAFKPVGHLMVGLPTQDAAQALATSLQQAGWAAGAVVHFSPRESVDELQALIDNAGAMAGFGYEITLMRRYLALARDGVRWLLVKVDDTDHAERAAALARSQGALLAVHYRLLTVEELI